MTNLLKKTKKENIELLIGGFPCQGFSIAGLRNPDDPRNKLYKNVIETLTKLDISFFVLENVEGIANMRTQKGKIIDKIKKHFNRAGYYIQEIKLNSVNFSVPQSRKRVIFIGCKKNNQTWKNAVDKTINELATIKRKQKATKEVLKKYIHWKEDYSKNHIIMKHQNKTIQKISKLKSGESLYPSYSESWKRLDYKKPSPTIKENHGAVHIHPELNRCLTPRELAALQTFKDNFIFKGPKKAQLVQIGNAVPVKFAKSIAMQFKKNIQKVK